MTVREMLAVELHRQYRAAEKAMLRAATGRASMNLLIHDHGWSACSKQSYFLKRADLIMKRATCTDPFTLGEAEQALDAAVLQRRLIVGLPALCQCGCHDKGEPWCAACYTSKHISNVINNPEYDTDTFADSMTAQPQQENR